MRRLQVLYSLGQKLQVCGVVSVVISLAIFFVIVRIPEIVQQQQHPEQSRLERPRRHLSDVEVALLYVSICLLPVGIGGWLIGVLWVKSMKQFCSGKKGSFNATTDEKEAVTAAATRKAEANSPPLQGR